MTIRRLPMDVTTYRLPKPQVPRITTNGFMACPIAVQHGLTAAQLLWQCAIYQMAFIQAEAELRPSLPERDLLAVWN
jgi:hypothetical protein